MSCPAGRSCPSRNLRCSAERNLPRASTCCPTSRKAHDRNLRSLWEYICCRLCTCFPPYRIFPLHSPPHHARDRYFRCRISVRPSRNGSRNRLRRGACNVSCRQSTCCPTDNVSPRRNRRCSPVCSHSPANRHNRASRLCHSCNRCCPTACTCFQSCRFDRDDTNSFRNRRRPEGHIRTASRNFQRRNIVFRNTSAQGSTTRPYPGNTRDRSAPPERSATGNHKCSHRIRPGTGT
jgi:hypothetical protein